MKTHFGKKIVFIVTKNLDEFINLMNFRTDKIPSPYGSQGVVYTRDKNYRYVYDVQTLQGHCGVEVEFMMGSECRPDYKLLKKEAERASRK